jgi:hypothetical protein
VLDSKPGEESREDEGDELPFLARQPEHRSPNMPHLRLRGKRHVGFARFAAAPARGCPCAMEHSAKWFLKKHEDGGVFGPVDFSKLKEWARAAQVSPQDMVSDDRVNWVKAPMLQQLHMDYLIQLGDESYYGPTTEEAVQEFLRLGEIHADTVLINCCTGALTVLRDSGFFQGQPPPLEDIAAGEPGRRTIRQNLQQRIRELELLLVERRRELEMAEARIRQLERRLQDAGLRAD